jgi:aconitase B
MKNIKLALLAGLFVVASGNAVAADVPLAATGTIKTTDCALLNENVQINLTSGVQGGVSCSDTAVAITTCHTAGRITSREVEKLNCVAVDPDDATKGETCTSFTPNKQYETKSGPAMPTATTLAGTVANEYPGSGICDAAAAVSVAAGKLEN